MVATDVGANSVYHTYSISKYLTILNFYIPIKLLNTIFLVLLNVILLLLNSFQI